ncbi:N-formylglutamate amidohydrolase [Aureimonas populi]|uniref:N-formylglutamate amidohydrolase n=1 Tax=Aureimonas populi TaxID=1701758 RepID=A0ABW5CHS5_9HYPH|nr:N-formylglutamate amidohydrolase [Aureimonas populi]
MLITAAGPCPAFELFEPARQTSPFVFCSAHSGRAYPASFLASTRLKGTAIRRSEDLFVDQLFDFVPGLGAPFLIARFPRAYLDVNREPYELDPAMFEGELPAHVNSTSARVAGGLGTIPRIVAERQEIYAGKLAAEEALARIEDIYMPFHETLAGLIERTVEMFGMAILIDCHSMPSTVRALPGGRRPDIVIGDRFGTSAGARIVAAATARLSALGWDVRRNKPYAGGYVTERYGRPRRGVHAIQIELNRALYADEANFLPHHGFEAMRESLRAFVGFFTAEMEAELLRPAAAE